MKRTGAIFFSAIVGTSPALATPVSVLFVGNSFTFARVAPALQYNAANVHDLTAAFNAVDPSGTNSFPVGTGVPPNPCVTPGTGCFEPHNWGGVPGILKKMTDEAGLDYDISLSTRNAATLRGQFLDTASPAWLLRENVATRRWDVVVLQEQSDAALPPGKGKNAKLEQFNAYASSDPFDVQPVVRRDGNRSDYLHERFGIDRFRRFAGVLPSRAAGHQSRPHGGVTLRIKGINPMIQLKNIERSYKTAAGQTWVLRRINLDIREGEFITIMGPSGAGKSSLLNVLALLDDQWAGEYWFRDQAVHEMKRKQRSEVAKKNIGVVFQSYHLLDDLTVRENIDLPLSYKDIPRNQRQGLVADTLDRFQIVAKKDLYPSQLSGGQQQLVGIARAVIHKPLLLLADEPTGNLHSSQAKEIMELFRELNQAGTTIVQVTHSEVNASYGSRTIQLRDGWLVGDTSNPSIGSSRGGGDAMNWLARIVHLAGDFCYHAGGGPIGRANSAGAAEVTESL